MRSLRVSSGRTNGSSDDGSLELYLRDIARYPLITSADEASLSDRIHAGDAEARDHLVRSNLRFVVAVAKQYQNRGVSLADLINEGNLGLLHAAQKFDGTKGVRFISYAVWWIRQAILQAIGEQARLIRLPLNRSSALYRLSRRAAALRQELGRDPTATELADGSGMTVEEVEEAQALAGGTVSLDAPLVPGEEIRLQDYLADPQAPGADAGVLEHELVESLADTLAAIGPRESRVLRLYYGLDLPEPMTLEEIGALLGITRERVRQIKERGLQRIRLTARPGVLESFLEG